MSAPESSRKTSCCVPTSPLWVLLLMVGGGLTGLLPRASAQSLPNELGHWQFEEGTGTTTADSSTNGLTGTLAGTPLPSWVAPGAMGLGALEFPGNANTRVDIGNPTSLQLTGAMTLSAWAYPDTLTQGRIITKGGGGGARGWALNTEPGFGGPGIWRIQIAASGSTLISCNTVTNPPALGTWTHVAGVYDPGEPGGPSLKIYLNGVLAYTTNSGTVPLSQFNPPAIGVAIGARSDGTTRWDGKIDEVRIFNRALTQAEIQALPELVTTPLAFTLQPVSRTIVQNRPVTFQTAFTGSGPYSIQWYENDSPIFGANGIIYTIPSVASSMDNYTYRVSVSNSLYGITSTNAVLTVSSDTNAPILASVGSVDGSYIGVCFSEPMDQNLFWDPSHFTVNGGGVVVSGSAPRPDGYAAVLSLSAPITGTFFVQVTGVTDLVGNPIAPGSSATGSVSGLTFADLGSPNQIGDTFSCRTDGYEMTAGGSDFGGGSDSGHFASRQVGGDFDVSVHVPSLTPVNSISKAGLMVRQTLDANSPTLHLLANPPPPTGRGYIEALRRSTVGGATTGWGTTFTTAVMPDVWVRLRRWGDQFAAFRSANGVDWVLMGQTILPLSDPVFLGLAATARDNNADPTVAKFQDFGNVVFTNVTVAFTEQPTNTSIPQNTTATLYVGAEGTGAPASELAYQWQRGNGAGGFTNLPGATATTYSFVARGADNNAQFRAQVYFAGLITNSATVTFTAIPETTRPAVVSVVSAGDPTKIYVVFSEELDPVSAVATANYGLSGPGSPPGISAAALGNNAWTVILTTSAALAEGPIYTLGVSSVFDLAVPPNAVTNTHVNFQHSSLAGYWPFEEGAGATTADGSGNNFTGTLLNGPTWVPGQLGQFALDFDGSNDRVDVGNPALLQLAGPMTVAAWVWADSLSDNGRIVTKGGASGNRGWALNVEGSGVWALQIASSPTTLVSLQVPDVPLNAWVHVAGVYDPNDVGGPIMKLYTNGVLGGTLTADVPAVQSNSGLNVSIGARADGTTRWNGKIDDVRIYARALSDADIAVLATPPAAPPIFLPPTLVNNELILDWTGQGQLQSAPAVTGSYTNITPAPNPPYTNAIVPGENRFFRLLATP